jgi:hypothetical protein
MLQLHVFVATGWMLGLALQVALIRTSRAHVHRLVGLGMMALAPLVVVTAIGAEVVSQRFYTPQFAENARAELAAHQRMIVTTLSITVSSSEMLNCISRAIA